MWSVAVTDLVGALGVTDSGRKALAFPLALALGVAVVTALLFAGAAVVWGVARLRGRGAPVGGEPVTPVEGGTPAEA